MVEFNIVAAESREEAEQEIARLCGVFGLQPPGEIAFGRNPSGSWTATAVA